MEINKYEKVLEDFIEKTKLRLNDRLKLILLIGSFLSKKYINNWSDIDLIIVVDRLDEKILDYISEISNDYDVKIGITLYSEKEINNSLIDIKTSYYFYLYSLKKFKIPYIDVNFKLPKISKELLLDRISIGIFTDLHVCKRNLLYKNLNRNIARTQFKLIYNILKKCLILKDIYPLNYEETFIKATEEFNFYRFDYLKFIDDYVKDTIDYTKLKKISINLINLIEKVEV